MSTIHMKQATKPRPRPQSSKSRGIKFKQYIPPDERDPPRFFERLAEKIFGTSEERMRRKKERELKRKRKERLAQQVRVRNSDCPPNWLTVFADGRVLCCSWA
jgi:hypothetical protein